MGFPTFNQTLISLVIAIVIGVLGYLLFGTMGMDEMQPKLIFVNAITLGAFLGALLSPMFGKSTSTTSVSEDANPKTIFIGNLAFKANTEQLRELFGEYGNVQSVRIMTDRVTRRPRGFAFVEMDEKAADKAIKELNGIEFLGRQLRVNEGQEKKTYNNEAA